MIPAAGLVSAIVTQWLFKVGYETVATPLTYAVVGFLKRKEGVDVFDRDVTLSPLPFSQYGRTSTNLTNWKRIERKPCSTLYPFAC